jgi:type II secretory pathway pseudopilin PulG
MKRSYSLFEIILTVLLLSILYTIFIPKFKVNNLEELTNRISLYISFVRYKALIDDKYNPNNDLWHKKRWSLKFFRCRDEEDGIYYSIYSDNNESGIPGANDSLKDPLTQKNIYSSNYCKENNSNSKYVLLTKNFEIKDVKISCNETSSLGQISFGADGKIYSKLSNNQNGASEYEITQSCSIKFISKDNKNKEIIINPKTGYSSITN